ncbi:microfibril-associated glycoprotein 4-like [Mytilus galloprovincialis]|uniref:microfibril-associated glycoprotein 4-like n=1 Tax=Mytilus galloprovincialis TaxID=29158 RepID=UPI003F7C107D
MFKSLSNVFRLFALVSTATLNSSDQHVEVRLLDNQNAPLLATLDMSNANERVKQFVSDTIEEKMKTIKESVQSKLFVDDAIEAKMKNIEETVKSKQFVSDALDTKIKVVEVNLKSQIANFEQNLTDQLTNYIYEMVGKLYEENEKPQEPKPRPIDCEHVKTKRKRNGIYKIYPKHSVIGFDVYCDFEIDNTGWTVIQRRFNGKTDFYRGWETYEIGFGNLEAEFWLGNQNIHTITKQGTYELRVDISDFNGAKAYARYSTFSVGDSSTNYRLNVAGYSGNAGDSLDYHNGQAFTTKDRDNDQLKSVKLKNNCGIYRQGAGWYKACAYSNLNGLYIEGGQENNVKEIVWNQWKGSQYSMKSSSMMIRRLLLHKSVI